MWLEWLGSRITELICSQAEMESRSSADFLLDHGVDVIVSLEVRPYRISWKHGGERWIRRYFNTFARGAVPTDWELYNLLSFLRYETQQERNAAIWFGAENMRSSVMPSIREWLGSGVVQRVRLPETLHYCQACHEHGCQTRLLCHTTSLDTAVRVIECGFLQCASRARGTTGTVLAGAPENVAGDPPDYFDYVMFSWGNCTAGQRLVNERRLGHSPSDEELAGAFVPGVSFYFDRCRLEKHPGFVDDGYHPAKVKDMLELGPWLVAAAVPNEMKGMFGSCVSDTCFPKVMYMQQDDLKNWCSKAWQIVSRDCSRNVPGREDGGFVPGRCG